MTWRQLLAHLRDAAGIADAVGILEAIAELVWEIAEGAVVGVVTVSRGRTPNRVLAGPAKRLWPSIGPWFLGQVTAKSA